MKLNTRTQFESLKKGQWLENGNGVFEVTGEFNSYHDSIALAEVIFKDANCESYHFENENPYTTFNDVKGSEII